MTIIPDDAPIFQQVRAVGPLSRDTPSSDNTVLMPLKMIEIQYKNRIAGIVGA